MGVATAARRQLASQLAVRAFGQLVTAHSGRAARLERGRVDRPRHQLEAEANRYFRTGAAMRGRDDTGPIGVPVVSGRLTCGHWPVAAGELNTGHERRLGADEVAQLIGDRAEYLGRPGTPGYERGHPPQRSLLIGKLMHPCPVDWTSARPRVDGLAYIVAGVRRIHKADGSPMPAGRQRLRQVPSLRLTRGNAQDGYSGQAEFSMMSTKLAR